MTFLVYPLLSISYSACKIAFRAHVETAGRDRKISDTCRKEYSFPLDEKVLSGAHRRLVRALGKVGGGGEVEEYSSQNSG